MTDLIDPQLAGILENPYLTYATIRSSEWSGLSLSIARAPTKAGAFMVYLRARSLRQRISDDEWTRCIRAMFLYL